MSRGTGILLVAAGRIVRRRYGVPKLMPVVTQNEG